MNTKKMIVLMTQLMSRILDEQLLVVVLRTLFVAALARCRSIARSVHTHHPEMTMGQRVMGHGSNGSTILDGSRGSRVSVHDPLTRDNVIGYNVGYKITCFRPMS